MSTFDQGTMAMRPGWYYGRATKCTPVRGSCELEVFHIPEHGIEVDVVMLQNSNTGSAWNRLSNGTIIRFAGLAVSKKTIHAVNAWVASPVSKQESAD